jgi:threonylcarbamoyladenosine tRNA methylthiotransferase MtaB
MKTFITYTLGCKLNFTETSHIAAQLTSSGFRRTKAGEEADLLLINTCSVTDAADKKDRQAIKKYIRLHPNAFVVVNGCYAALKPEEVKAIDGVDLVLANNSKVVESIENGKLKIENEDELSSNFQLSTFNFQFQPAFSQDDRTRYFLKVQDGCDYFCTYCTVPLARGSSRNGSIADLVETARELAAKGAKEIVLSGVNIGDFGKTTGERFLDLIRELDKVEGVERYRISSIEPNLLTDEIIDFVANSQRFAPHFHIPLQAGSDEVLHLMKRRYNTDLFAHKIKKIKTLMPDAFIGVDVIVGTRGETAELFEEGYHFIASLDVSQLHVFSYSERANTAALNIPHIVSPKEKKKRSERLHQLSAEKTEAFYASQKGKCLKVLWEERKKDGKMSGFSQNYVRVEAPYDKAKVNTIETIVM